jgi:hypothetical protein
MNIAITGERQRGFVLKSPGQPSFSAGLLFVIPKVG